MANAGMTRHDVGQHLVMIYSQALLSSWHLPACPLSPLL